MGMEFAVLTRFFRFMPPEALARMNDELKSRGHKLVVIRPNEIRLRQGTGESVLYFLGQTWRKLDLLIQLLRWNDEYGWTVLEELQEVGQTTLKSNRMPHGDRPAMMKIFQQYGLRAPSTYVLTRAEIWRQRHNLPWPLQVQARLGQNGRLQLKSDNWNAFDEALQEYEQVLEEPLFVRDVRDLRGPVASVVVVGDRCLASVERPEGLQTIKPGRPLVMRTDKLRPAFLSTTDEKAVALVRRLYGVTHAVVDIKQTPAGPLILDVNTAPNLAWFERISGNNLVGKVVDFWEQLAKAAR